MIKQITATAVPVLAFLEYIINFGIDYETRQPFGHENRASVGRPRSIIGAGSSNIAFFRRFAVTIKTKYANLVKTKLALAKKHERLAKVCNSKPKQKTLINQAHRFRRQAEQFARDS